MDKTALIIVSVCVALLGYGFYTKSKTQPTRPQTAAPRAADTQPLVPARPADEQLRAAPDPVAPERNLAPEQLVTLENDYFRVITTTHGGGIKRVELKKHRLGIDAPVVLNNGAPLPVFNISGWSADANLIGYSVAASDTASVTFTRELQPGLIINRKFTVSGDYQLTLDQIITNRTGDIKVLPPYRLALGAVTALHPENAGAESRYVTLSWYSTGGKYAKSDITSFDGFAPLGFKFTSGKTVIGSDGENPVRWASVKSQFFAMIIDCQGFDALRAEGTRQHLPDLATRPGAAVPTGIVGDLAISGITINPDTSASQQFSLYAGPKENSRLQALPDHQAEIMEFGAFIGPISSLLLWLMNTIHGFAANYGLAIIIVTVIIRAVLWWPQSAANRSMKRMQAVAPLMKETQEKFKDKPEKLNQEMMKIYKEYGVNPVGSCLPMLIQFPIFLGFYWMLQSSIELRHEHFLWIKDLSQPDTVWRLALGGFSLPVNPMPLVMTLTMYLSMRISPQPQGVDNPMMKMMKFMPLFFLLFCYNFSSALSLYWTAQNILSIVQMRYNLKQVAPTLEAMKAQAAARRKQQRKR
ncbi:MAG: membrane protein insertase YidC [Verrucomicrobiales bacterium]|jgi:YidC/Oxa1 family membrane protein insertase|nr:membrane protein insertase YidC [Verrucomicrobiales bacterium]